MSDKTFVPGNSLFTDTPEEGRALAVEMARLTIKLTQPSVFRATNKKDADVLMIAIGQTIATEFATIAAANNYWK